MELLNFLGENFLFIYMGISVFSYTRHKWDPFFIIFSFLGIFLGRFLNVYPLAGIVNLTRRRSQRPPITIKYQHMIMFSGLRGAVAFALALREAQSGGDVSEAQQMMFSTTLLIVFVTVLLLGGATSSMLSYLQIPGFFVPVNSSLIFFIKLELKTIMNHLRPTIRTRPGEAGTNSTLKY
jgi:sodium/hydrogen exchanger-like protein 6/7